MNNKISYQELIETISQNCDISKKVCESFFKDFFAIIEENLTAGKSVKIKRLGTFKVTTSEPRKIIEVNSGQEMEIPAQNKVSFIPDKEIADAVNIAFAGFETVTLDDCNDDIIIQLNNSECIDKEDNTNSILPPPIPTTNNETNINNTETAENDNVDIAEDTQPEILDSIPQEEGTETLNNQEELNNQEADMIENEDEQLNNDDKKGNNKFAKGFFWGFISATCSLSILLIIVSQFIGLPMIINNYSSDIKTDTIAEAKITNAQATKIQAEADSFAILSKAKELKVKVKLDTIGKNRFLTTMARENYGDYNFWVYIYEENKDILKNPNKIKPGTVVIIPDANKYNIDKNNPESLIEAKQKAYLIFKKFE
ncbi:MAG: HU family DNA-binding protein [Muribaculaceae bacterium]|nr:HU family DNA-binding protein [Muribaculaceae bacterium]